MLATKQTQAGGTRARDEDLATALRHHTDGRLDDAAQLYQRLHAANPRDCEVLFLMGVLCRDLGLFEAACRFLEQALAIAPEFPEARSELAVALNGLADLAVSAGKLTEARQFLEKAFELLPGDASSLRGLGRMALMQGDAATAETRLLASLARHPDHAEALNWLGLARVQMEQYAAAEAPLRQALRLQPDLNQARNNLGLALFHQGRLSEAQPYFEEALAHDPAYRNARINLAVTLRIFGQHARARCELEAVLAAHPDEVDALNNLGVVFQDLGLAELALTNLARAIALSPASPPIRWNLALTQLLLGDFKNGWANYEARWEGCEHLRGSYQLPAERAWRGEELHGKRLLLWSEQGFGDTLQFIRFAQDAALRGATVSVLTPPELVQLVRSAPGVSAVFAQGGPPPPYDLHCPLMSLPYRLGVSLDPAQLHGATPYLFAANERSEHWRQRLSAHRGLKVGLVWAGNARRQSLELRAVDLRRSIALRRLAPILSVTDCVFFSLQKGAAAAELTAAQQGEDSHGADPHGAGPRIDAAKIQDFSAEWADFSDTAAFVANLDLVISVDTAVAHLAGALGKPVWLLNRYDSCWRWLLGRSDSPWYGSLRQFRQHAPADWEPVIAAAAVALAKDAAAPQAQR
ncbi:MAG: tetratricopeptide repeat protein [Steroidobacteraceae bacterium]